MKKYIIVSNKKWYLSKECDKSIEEIIGFGGIWKDNLDNVRIFKTRKAAEETLELIKKALGNKTAKIVEV